MPPPPLLPIAGRCESGLRGLGLAKKGYLLWIKKEF